jgi:hypothetical protein
MGGAAVRGIERDGKRLSVQIRVAKKGKGGSMRRAANVGGGGWSNILYTAITTDVRRRSEGISYGRNRSPTDTKEFVPKIPLDTTRVHVGVVWRGMAWHGIRWIGRQAGLGLGLGHARALLVPLSRHPLPAANTPINQQFSRKRSDAAKH